MSTLASETDDAGVGAAGGAEFDDVAGAADEAVAVEDGAEEDGEETGDDGAVAAEVEVVSPDEHAGAIVSASAAAATVRAWRRGRGRRRGTPRVWTSRRSVRIPLRADTGPSR